MLQVLLQVDVLLGSNQHEGLLITQVFLCLVSNIIHWFNNNCFWWESVFLDFSLWIQGYRTVQTAHCALLTLLWINYINRLLTLFTLFGILSYCFLFLVFTSLTWKSTLHPHSRSLLCPGSWKDSTLPFMTLWQQNRYFFIVL